VKYPLAIVSMILDILGDNNALAYDIGCAFDKTVAQSKLLGVCAAAQALRFIVPSFHGHAHNRACQLQYHPQYITSVRIEDFETCERCFSISNGLAATTRLATDNETTTIFGPNYKGSLLHAGNDHNAGSFAKQILWDAFIRCSHYLAENIGRGIEPLFSVGCENGFRYKLAGRLRQPRGHRCAENSIPQHRRRRSCHYE